MKEPGARLAVRASLLLAALLLAACASPHFSVDDGVRFQNGQSRFVAFAQKQMGWRLSGIPDVEVRFLVDGHEVSRAVTDERGFAKTVVQVEGPTDRFEATADFDDDSFRAEGRVFSWQSDRVIVACDIDSTISNTSLNALFFHELDFVSTPIEDSPQTLGEIARDHQIIYITARPRFTLPKTQAWLEEHGYPDGPVVTSLTVRDTLGQTGYKTRTIRSVRKYYTNLLIGVGNTDIDAESYSAHGMLVLLVQPKREMGHDGSVFHFQNWDRLRAAIEKADQLKLPAAEPLEAGFQEQP